MKALDVARPCPFCETYVLDEEDACCNELRQSREIRRLRRLLRKKNARIRAAEARGKEER